MSLDISGLNGVSYNELHATELLAVGNGVSISGNTYTVTPDHNGNLALYDVWSGFLGSPQPGDITTVTLSTGYSNPGSPYGVVGYVDTYGNGATVPATGVLGAEIVGWNSTGVLLEQLTGFVPNAFSAVTPDGYYFIVGTQDLSTFDGSISTSASFTFTQTGEIPSTAIPGGSSTPTSVPEPASVILMPIMVVGLMLARLPAVRSFLGAR